jgi:hypothetical protein
MHFRIISLSLLTIGLLYGTTQDTPEGGFDKTLTKEGVSFHIQATQKGSLNTLTVTPKGLSKSNRPETTEIDGTVSDAKIGDINHDGAPEIYIVITSAGSGSYGSLVAYSTNHHKSMSVISLPELDPHSKEAQEYMGHDTFTLTENRLIRRYPVYKKGDPNYCPTGGIRKLSYILVPGEATWQLKLESSKIVQQ